ncbi:MAG: hypothetical protein GF405_07695 [Candidatus Eisenbacteria bacterium]|nr:hypothetical protein [Candidatus Eisenbacteria bacterium]
MKRMLVVALALVLSVPLSATTSREGLPDAEYPERGPYGTARSVADVLICLDIDANRGFGDPTPLYADAFAAAGAQIIATCRVETPGGSINFPTGMTADNYPVVVVLTSDNWWATPKNIDPADESALAAYLDTGGNLLFVGQDYMVGAHPSMGPTSGFPRDYLGLDHCHQDVLWGETTATITGSPGWIADGLTLSLTASTVFTENTFYPDCADPVADAGSAFSYDEAARDGVVIYHDPGGFKTVWSGIELSAAATASFHVAIDTIYHWFLGASPVVESTWGEIKRLYR